MYESKLNMIADVLKTAREMKSQYDQKKQPCNGLWRNKTYYLQGETWHFDFFVDNKIRTECNVIDKYNNQCFYPRTNWGEYGKRWDSDLKEFLMREIQKEG